ncbi:MAG: ATP-grasp domain-containing protein [Gammaproteobacteria bacterium]|jgi:carbamoyl-phosphate synthase large subunit
MTINPTVAITGMNAKPDNPGPGLAVARCLRESPEFTGRIVGLGYDALDPGLYLKEFCNAGYLMPYPSAGDEALINTLKQLKETENIDVLIPCLDAELPGMIRLRPVIEDLGMKVFLPSPEQLRLRNKDRLNEIAQHAGIEWPETKSITSAGFFYKCQDQGWSFPFLIKGLFYDAQIVYSAEEANEAFRRIAAEWGFPVLVQKLVKGEEYNLSAVGDGNGNMLGAVMIKKMATTDKGKAWSGITIDDQTLYNASAKLIKAIKWRGPLEVEVIRDRNGVYQLIEINPRFPAWIYISSGVGRNLPLALLQLALGMEPSGFDDIRTGMLFIRYAQETITTIQDFESLIMNGGHTLTD